MSYLSYYKHLKRSIVIGLNSFSSYIFTICVVYSRGLLIYLHQTTVNEIM